MADGMMNDSKSPIDEISERVANIVNKLIEYDFRGMYDFQQIIVKSRENSLIMSFPENKAFLERISEYSLYVNLDFIRFRLRVNRHKFEDDLQKDEIYKDDLTLYQWVIKHLEDIEQTFIICYPEIQKFLYSKSAPRTPF